LPVGTPVEATLRNVGLVRGVVAWSAGGFVGIRFDTMIDPKETMPQVGNRKESDLPPRPGPNDFRRPGLRISDD
jgi:hypothetical protein